MCTTNSSSFVTASRINKIINRLRYEIYQNKLFEIVNQEQNKLDNLFYCENIIEKQFFFMLFYVCKISYVIALNNLLVYHAI